MFVLRLFYDADGFASNFVEDFVDSIFSTNCDAECVCIVIVYRVEFDTKKWYFNSGTWLSCFK